MYRVTRNSCVPKKLRITFNTYEEARSAIRKWLRATRGEQGNPSISIFGFSIVAA